MLAKAIGERIEKRKRRLRRFMAERRLPFDFFFFWGNLKEEGMGETVWRKARYRIQCFPWNFWGSVWEKWDFIV